MARPYVFLALLSGVISILACEGGGGGAGGSAGGGGGGAGGGPAACASATDCALPQKPCEVATCTAGVCGTALVPAGFEVLEQVEGDCLRTICDGAGSLVTDDDDDDVLDDGNPCTLDTCSAAGPTNEPMPTGTPCNGAQMCDGAGTCVECLGDADCDGGLCIADLCVPASCVDGVENSDETDQDCGGSCPGCADGLQCLVGADCESGVCVAGVCASPTCGDGVVNGGDVCDDGNLASGDGCDAGCLEEPGFDCAGVASICTPVCGDGALVGSEPCDDGNALPGDGCDPTCAVEPGWACSGAPSVCTPPVCGDGVPAPTEGCDDGNLVGGDGCDAACVVEPGFACLGAPSICAPACGDGIVIAPEQCDDGNQVAGDGCSPSCLYEVIAEIEPNDDIGAAAASYPAGLPLGGIDVLLTGAIDPNWDPDYWPITLAQTSDLDIHMTVTAGGTCSTLDTYLELRRPDGLPLAADDDNGGANCSRIQSAVYAGARHLPAGTYYVRGASYNGAQVIPGYQIVVTLDAVCGNGVVEGYEECDGGVLCDAGCDRVPVCGDGFLDEPETCDDGGTLAGDGCSPSCTIEGALPELSPNETLADADASPLQLTGSALVAGSIGAPGDHDLYRLTLAADAVVRFETFEPSKDCPTIATALALLAADGTALHVDYGSGIGGCSALTVALAAGTYYVDVAAVGVVATIPAYLLEVSVHDALGAESEPNETLAQANALADTGDVYVVGGHQDPTDSDWFAFVVPAGASLRAEVIEGDLLKTCDSTNLDSRLWFYDAAGTLLGNDDDDGRGSCSLIDGTGAAKADPFAGNLPAGTYYLRVASYGLSGSTNQFDYRLAVVVR